MSHVAGRVALFDRLVTGVRFASGTIFDATGLHPKGLRSGVSFRCDVRAGNFLSFFDIIVSLVLP